MPIPGNYHVYEDGYSVLPKLHKLGSAPIFEWDSGELAEKYLSEKQAALETQPCWLEHRVSDEILREVCELTISQHPRDLCFADVDPRARLAKIALSIQEDIVVHRIDDKTDWMAAAHICLPSAWAPEEVIGKSFIEAHQPVPGMDLRQSRRIVEAMVYQGPFERFQWGVVFEERLNFHPKTQAKQEFSLSAPVLFVKVERQILVGLPKLQAIVFVLREHLIPENEINKPALLAALQGMNPAEVRYKSLEQSMGRVIQYLADA